VFSAYFFLGGVIILSSTAQASSPNYIQCSGQLTYSGVVYNEEGQGLGGVWVHLVAIYPYTGSGDTLKPTQRVTGLSQQPHAPTMHTTIGSPTQMGQK